MDTLRSWLAIQTKPRNEKKVDYLLRQKGYECLTPIYRSRRRWSDRIVEIDSPLFPMYVFCRLSSSALGKAISTSGVVRIVGFNGQPAEVAVEEIESLQLLMQSKLLREPWKYLPHGTPVIVETGPLAGVMGIILQEEKNRRLIVSVTLLQRSVAIQLDENTVVSTIHEPKKGGPRCSAGPDIAPRLLAQT